MSKFLSALTADKKVATKNLQFILDNMAPGALLVYLDNSGGGTKEWVSGVAGQCGMIEVRVQGQGGRRGGWEKLLEGRVIFVIDYQGDLYSLYTAV